MNRQLIAWVLPIVIVALAGCQHHKFGLVQWPVPQNLSSDEVEMVADPYRRLSPSECVPVAIDYKVEQAPESIQDDIRAGVASVMSKSERYSIAAETNGAPYVVVIEASPRPQRSRTSSKTEEIVFDIAIVAKDVRHGRICRSMCQSVFDPGAMEKALDRLWAPAPYVTQTYGGGRYAQVDVSDGTLDLQRNDMVVLFTHEKKADGSVGMKFVSLALVLHDGHDLSAQSECLVPDGRCVRYQDLPANYQQSYKPLDNTGRPLLEMFNFKWTPAQPGLCVLKLQGPASS